jgi:transposase-like protein
MKALRRNEWITIAEAAQRLNVDQTRIRQWIHRNKDDIARKGPLLLYRDIEQIEARIRHPA